MYRFLACCVVVVVYAPFAAADEPTQEQKINRLLTTLKSGKEEDQKKAAHALWDAIYYKGIGTLRPKDVVSELADGLEHKDDDVRRNLRSAILVVRDESALPLYLKWLDDPSLEVRSAGAGGLAGLGPKAKDHIPLLSKKISEGKVFSYGALAELAGKDAVPVILEAVAKHKPDGPAMFTAITTLAKYPDPRAAEFMGKLLDERKSLVWPALFFAAIADEPALARLRKCLAMLPADPKAHPLSTDASDTASVRSIAVEALGKKKDKDSFDAILKMVSDDPSIRVRTAAVVAMGAYEDKKAVPVLAKALQQKDEGFDFEGHPAGTLRRAAVRALGRIGTDDALAALYAGMKEGQAKTQCSEFWTSSKEPKHLAAFLKLHDADPLSGDLAAGTIDSLLRNHEDKQLTAKEQTAAEEEFFKKVDDAPRFGPKADLSEGGKWRVQVTYTFRAEGFVTVNFNFRDINPRGFGHGYSVLYRKTGDKWKPVGKSGGFVE